MGMNNRRSIVKKSLSLAGLVVIAGCVDQTSSDLDDGENGNETPTTMTASPEGTQTTEPATESPVTLKVTQGDEEDLSQYSDEEIREFEELTQEQQDAFREAHNSGSTTLDGEFDPGGPSDAPRVVRYDGEYYRMDYYRA
ncbi:hypothetical protein JCM17823_27230 [Halorubrum gandharaense]